MSTRRHGEIVNETDTSPDPAVRLSAATYLRWRDRVETLLRRSQLPGLPAAGVVQYFSDHLAVAVLIGYERIGSTVQLDRSLTVPNPEAYADPLRVLRLARTPGQLDILRRSLYSRHKVLIHRNTLVHIDREEASDVFGPSIDTLFLNDWLHANRYAHQRTPENHIFFEDPLTRDATERSHREGCSFLEIGCGNGLLTASFARNEARVRSFATIDVSHAAIAATYANAATQRQLHGSTISARGRFTIGTYELASVPAPSDLVVCNPPYLPGPPADLRTARSHPLATATLGTELLQSVVMDAASLISSTGQMLLVSSTLAEPEIRAALPTGMLCRRLASRRVPFDIEAVRTSSGDNYVAWLEAERGLRKVGQTLSHDIAIYGITHQDGSAPSEAS